MQRPPHSPHSSRPSSPVSAAAPHHALPLLAPPTPAEPHTPQRRLLVPIVRPTRAPPRPAQSRTRTGRLSRQSRSNSMGHELQGKDGQDWALSLGRMHVVDQLEVRGYQIYAVEKWVVERGRLINVVSVFTGDSSHKITVAALSPFSSLSDVQAQAEFDNAVHILRRDGARPRETEHGVLLVTSLANFRSDYNLVHIPDGNFLAAREQLYVNINLLRMGCSGRTALTLHEPSEPTKDRYLTMYCFSEPVLSSTAFNHCVLELVKLVQAALALFGMFDVSPDERDGLLCDVTAEGIQSWTDQVGRPMLFLEPMERVGDPSVVSALLSLVMTMRNKLHSLGITQVPKDPFQDLAGFMHAVAALRPPPGGAAAPGALALETVAHINAMYDRRAPEYRVPRIILGKLDEITAELNLRGHADAAHAAAHVYATADLAGFVQAVRGAASRDAAESLRALWTGRVPHHHPRKKARREGAEEDERGTDGRSTEDDDGAQGLFQNWPKHMKIDGLKGFDFGLGRSKKPSVDLAGGGRPRAQRAPSGDEAPAALLPAAVLAGQAEHARASKDSGAEGSVPSANPSSFGLASARSSHVNLAPPERAALPLRLPRALSTAAAPLRTARDERRAFLRRASAYEQRADSDAEDAALESERRANRGRLLGAARRRHSVHDLAALRERPPPAVERMKVDVGLCGQYLIMRRRELHLQHTAALLQHLQAALRRTNAALHDDLAAHAAPLRAVARARDAVAAALAAARARCAEWGGTQDALQYQAAQMAMRALWRGVRAQRARVLAARAAVFAAPPGARPAPGSASRRFFRVQATLDAAAQRLVDWAGRTESEAEEERAIPPEEPAAVWPPPYEELRAYAAATRAAAPARRRWWWWPFGARDAAGKGSDDETSAAATAQGEDAAPAVLSPDD